jgi:hypothetical protein
LLRGLRLLSSNRCQRFLQQAVTRVDLQALARRPDLAPCAQRILSLQPDLIELILPILSERFQYLSPSQIIATLGISKDFWRHTRACQDILEEGKRGGASPGLPARPARFPKRRRSAGLAGAAQILKAWAGTAQATSLMQSASSHRQRPHSQGKATAKWHGSKRWKVQGKALGQVGNTETDVDRAGRRWRCAPGWGAGGAWRLNEDPPPPPPALLPQ